MSLTQEEVDARWEDPAELRRVFGLIVSSPVARLTISYRTKEMIPYLDEAVFNVTHREIEDLVVARFDSGFVFDHFRFDCLDSDGESPYDPTKELAVIQLTNLDPRRGSELLVQVLERTTTRIK